MCAAMAFPYALSNWLNESTIVDKSLDLFDKVKVIDDSWTPSALDYIVS